MEHGTLSFNIAFTACLANFVVSMVYLVSRKRLIGRLVTALFAIALVAITWFIASRWLEAGYPPFSNKFESLVCFAWCLVAVYLALEFPAGLRPLAPAAAAVAMGLLGFAWLEDRTIRPLLPALQNNLWLTTHVILCFLGYAAFLMGMLLALAHLLSVGDADEQTGFEPFSHRGGAFALTWAFLMVGAVLAWLKIPPSDLLGGRILRAGVLVALVAAAVVFIATQRRLFLFLADKHDRFEHGCYLAVAFGFPFLGAGIATGSIWANVAWGRYWGWDPKETSSLVTWLIFAIYLHLRFVAKKRSPWLSWMVVLGFLGVLFTYFGINYLQSLHAYGG